MTELPETRSVNGQINPGLDGGWCQNDRPTDRPTLTNRGPTYPTVVQRGWTTIE